MDEKMIIRSSVSSGVNGNSTYSYTLMIGEKIILNKVTRDEITKVIRADLDLKKRIYNCYENFDVCPEELLKLDKTPKEQLMKSVLGIPVIIFEHPEEKTKKFASGIHTVGMDIPKEYRKESQKEDEQVYDDKYVHFTNDKKRKKR